MQLQKTFSYIISSNILKDVSLDIGEVIAKKGLTSSRKDCLDILNIYGIKNLEDLRFNNYPLMVGASRKSMINKVLDTDPSEALAGTISLNTMALINGANIIRVHDVREAKQVISIVKEYNKSNN